MSNKSTILTQTACNVHDSMFLFVYIYIAELLTVTDWLMLRSMIDSCLSVVLCSQDLTSLTLSECDHCMRVRK